MDHTTFAKWINGLGLIDIARVFDQLGRELQSRELYNLAFRADLAAEMTRDRYFGTNHTRQWQGTPGKTATEPRVGHGQDGVQ